MYCSVSFFNFITLFDSCLDIRVNGWFIKHVCVCVIYIIKREMKYILFFSLTINTIRTLESLKSFSKTVINIEAVSPIILNEMPLPYFREVKHLGNILQFDNSISTECSVHVLFLKCTL